MASTALELLLEIKVQIFYCIELNAIRVLIKRIAPVNLSTSLITYVDQICRKCLKLKSIYMEGKETPTHKA